MGSAVRSRPSHYETLGLAPAASSDEIARAFAREISASRPRAFGGLAEVGIAYETLRNPVKRRAYDVSLGLGSEPRPPYAPTTLRIAAQFISSAPGGRAERPVDGIFARPAPVMKQQLQPELSAEPRTASFIAESLRDPPGPTPQDDIFPGARPQPNQPRRPEPGPGPQIGDRILHRAEKARVAEAEDRPVEWKRPAIVIGATVAAVALLGALAGWQAGHGEPQQTQAGVTAALPPPRPSPAAVLPPAPASRVADAQSRRLPRAAVAAARARRTPARPRPIVSDEQLSQGTQFEPSQPEEQANAQAVAESRPMEAAAALPLPNAVIARTIERIGYACGQVASTGAVGGESRGAFKVTCTSGLSYQATPVRGRYHFRRLGSR